MENVNPCAACKFVVNLVLVIVVSVMTLKNAKTLKEDINTHLVESPFIDEVAGKPVSLKDSGFKGIRGPMHWIAADPTEGIEFTSEITPAQNWISGRYLRGKSQDDLTLREHIDKRDKWFKHTVNAYIVARVLGILVSTMEIFAEGPLAIACAGATWFISDLEATMAVLITASLVYVEDEQGNLGFLFLPYTFFVVYFVVFVLYVPFLLATLSNDKTECCGIIVLMVFPWMFSIPVCGMLLDYYPYGTKNVLDQFNPVTSGIDDWEMDTDALKQMATLLVIENVWDFVKKFLSFASAGAATGSA